ncbi:hypothetical protein ACJZ2D_013913 [Fusarium nematophilum]
MGFDALSKLATAGEAVFQNLTKKWEERKTRHAIDAKLAEQIRQRNEFLSLVTAKLTGDSSAEMAPLFYDPSTNHKAVFLVTTPIAFGRFELSGHSYKLLARHVGMSLNSVSHWAVLEFSALGKNYFRVAAITAEFIATWSSCYYIGETTKAHHEIEQLGRQHMALNPRYHLLSSNCQHLVETLVKELCNGKVISQAKLDEELALASPKIARDLIVARIRSKMDAGGESEDSPSVKEYLEGLKRHWGDGKK